jgi:hypothetical protein
VKPLPRPGGTGPAAAVTLPPEGRRRRRGDFGKWLVGGAVAAGALVVAILAGAFERPSGVEGAATGAAPAAGEGDRPRKKKARASTDELRSPDAPPRTVGNSQPVGGSPEAAGTMAPAPEPARVVTDEPAAAKPAAEPPIEPAKPAAAEPAPAEPVQAAAVEPAKPAPTEPAKPAITATEPAKPPAVAAKPPAVAAKPPAVAAKPPAAKPAPTKPPPRRKPPAAKPTGKAPSTPPKWNPDDLFLKPN